MEGTNEEEVAEPAEPAEPAESAEPAEPTHHIHTFTLPIEMLQGFMGIHMNLGNPINDEDISIIDNPLEQSITNQSFHQQPKYKNVASKDFIKSLSVQKVSQEMVDQKITCGICLDELVLGEDIIELPCSDKHYFHMKKDECGGIYPWLEEHNSCPLCRHEFESEEKEVIEEEVPHDIQPVRFPTLQNMRTMLHQIIDEEEERILQSVLLQSYNSQNV